MVEKIKCCMCADEAYFIAEETGEKLCERHNTENNSIRIGKGKQSIFNKIIWEENNGI